MKYQEQTATGSTWIRCKNLTIENSLTATPTANFQESRVSEVNGQVSEQYIGSLVKVFDPAAGVIPLRNPETGDLTGTIVTHADLYVILYSLYMQTALERDGVQP